MRDIGRSSVKIEFLCHFLETESLKVSEVPYYRAFGCMEIYPKQYNFFEWSDGFVCNCRHEVIRDKCMHQHTKHLYFKLPSNFEKLRNVPSMTILKDAQHNETRLKQFLFVFKRIEIWNNNFAHRLLLLDGEKLWHALLYDSHGFFPSPKNRKFGFTWVHAL